MVADRLTLGVPRAQDPLGDLVLAAESASEVQETVRVIRVATAQSLPLEVQPDLRGVLRHALLGEHHLLSRDAVLPRDGVDDGGVVHGRGVAVELEAVPHHVDLVTVLELLEGEREVPASEVTEGAQDV